MKRVVLLLTVVLLAGVIVWAALRTKVSGSSAAAVTDLLPAETLALLHVPDYLRTRDEWHRSDIYQIWREPSVQAFLQKPLANVPKNVETQVVLADIARLEPKDIFVALTALGDDPKTAAGFRFKGDAKEVEKIIGKAKAQLLAHFPNAKREVLAYQGHNIETIVADRLTFASVIDGQWFFAGNDPAGLKLILDRADGRLRDTKTLHADATFAAALKHVGATYAGLLYLQPQAVFDKVLPLLPAAGRQLSPEDTAQIRTLHSVCATTAFENGKLHDITFAGMPEAAALPKLTRDSLSLAPKSAFLYFAGLMNFAKRWPLPDAPADTSGALGSVQKFLAALAAQGVTFDEWKAAFGPELSLIGDWGTAGRWPSLLVSLPVKDAARARKIADALTSSGTAGVWQKEERDGAAFYSLQAMGGLVPIAPVVAVSGKILVAGLDRGSVQAALANVDKAATGLATDENFRLAARSVAPPTSAFAYIDTRLLFERLDATLRPMLLMGAAFVPAISQNADISKLPPTEAVAKHLSPIVMSQSYQGDGYVTESIGPVTINEAGLGLAAAVGASVIAFQQRSQLHALPTTTPSATLVPVIPDPSPTPIESATPAPDP